MDNQLTREEKTFMRFINHHNLREFHRVALNMFGLRRDPKIKQFLIDLADRGYKTHAREGENGKNTITFKHGDEEIMFEKQEHGLLAELKEKKPVPRVFQKLSYTKYDDQLVDSLDDFLSADDLSMLGDKISNAEGFIVRKTYLPEAYQNKTAFLTRTKKGDKTVVRNVFALYHDTGTNAIVKKAMGSRRTFFNEDQSIVDVFSKPINKKNVIVLFQYKEINGQKHLKSCQIMIKDPVSGKTLMSLDAVKNKSLESLLSSAKQQKWRDELLRGAAFSNDEKDKIIAHAQESLELVTSQGVKLPLPKKVEMPAFMKVVGVFVLMSFGFASFAKPQVQKLPKSQSYGVAVNDNPVDMKLLKAASFDGAHFSTQQDKPSSQFKAR